LTPSVKNSPIIIKRTKINKQVTIKERLDQPGDAFEDTAFKPGFEIANSHARL
jgi:hypothetical protein